jgi:hypothetical protein
MPERWQTKLRELGSLRPPGTLEGRIDWTIPESATSRRSTATRRLAAVAVAAALLAGAGYGTWRAFGHVATRPATRPAHGLRTYHNQRFGWAIRYPAAWRIGHFQSAGMIESDGVRITNFVPDLEAPSSGAPPMGWLRTFPPRGVALQIWYGERFPLPGPEHDTRLPVTLASLHPIARYVGASEPRPLFGEASGNGFSFAVAAWFGPHASARDRARVEAILASLHFPRLKAWTFWNDRYYVLGSAAQYPVRSVFLIPASRLPVPPGFKRSEPIYLVHAPGGFYAIDQHPTFQDRLSCDVQFHPETFRFSCPQLGLVWDRLGRLLTPGADREDINAHPATITANGQVLYSPFFGGVGRQNLWG